MGKGNVNNIKKTASRQCTGCGEKKDKKELIRVIKTPEGDITVDFTGKKNGRGAYICRNAECVEKAKKKNLGISPVPNDEKKLTNPIIANIAPSTKMTRPKILKSFFAF